MVCAEAKWSGGKGYVEAFAEKAMKLRIPLSGSIDLTHRCNLRCVHCYVGSNPGSSKKPSEEMDSRRLSSLIDEITEAGCLYLLITGGEPLMREDFGYLYRHAKSNGLIVTVFTNGTLMSDKALDLFAELPPHFVEISLYGASPRTYEKITGVEGSFSKCMDGVVRLLERKIEVRLKTVLMTLNRHEIIGIQEIADRLGVKFRLDAAIFPRLNGDRGPLALRVHPKEAVEDEFCDRKRAVEWETFVERFKDIPLPDTLYSCGAGLTGFHVDPYGMLRPCLMTPAPEFDLSRGSFSEGWRGVIPLIHDRVAAKDFACNSCEDSMLCGYCPAFFGLETGSEDVPSEYVCALGRYRREKIYGKI